MPKQSQDSLFGGNSPGTTPLAERMRPRSLAEIVGPDSLLGESTFLGNMLRGGPLRSMILWGPPGSGKTTIARLLSARPDAEFETLSAVLAGIKDLREVVARARARREREGRATILFVDEIHRFNKAQQDAFLPHVEAGIVCLVGATTENPSFEVIGPLLSRCRLIVFEPLDAAAIEQLLDRALVDRERGLGDLGVGIDPEARHFLAAAAHGDARAALSALEASADLAKDTPGRSITLAVAEEGLQRKALLYDKAGEEHYNVISAFIKSMRGGNADAALYWLARMLEAGEDPLFIARRMVVFASEDVGLADSHALLVANAVKDAVHFVGLPEARINLAHGAAYLALAPKCNSSYAAIEDAIAEVKRSGPLPVPKHLRNAPTPSMRDLGYGKGYVYPPANEKEARKQTYLPSALGGRRFLKRD